MKKYTLFVLLFFAALSVRAEAVVDSLERQAVIAVIDQLFEGMLKGDSTLVRETFASEARLMTVVKNREGTPKLYGGEGIQDFLNAVGTPHELAWDERIWSYDIRIDGQLATAWTEYTFFRGDQLSHCGVNAFQLFKSADGWKIIQITDTRRKKDCKS